MEVFGVALGSVPLPDFLTPWQDTHHSLSVLDLSFSKCHMNIIAHYVNYLYRYLVFHIVFRFSMETNSQELGVMGYYRNL